MKTEKVLITGADGYVGAAVARLFLNHTEAPLLLWVRAANAEEFSAKHRRLEEKFGAGADRVSYGWGDLKEEQPFDGIDPGSIGTIIHSAAVTRFNVDAETALRVNVQGTEKLLDFAAGCTGLERIALLSTVYASGLRSGPIEEVAGDNAAGFANHYEQSKWASEQLLLKEYADLPWQILRLATVIAADEAGNVVQQNAFHNTLRLLYYGLLSLVPGRAETPLYFITGEFAADAVFSLLRDAPLHQIYHLAHTRSESVSLGKLLDLVFAAFEEQSEFKIRQVLRPLYTDPQAFQLLADGINGFGNGILNQAVTSVAPFAPQLVTAKEVRNDNTITWYDGYRAPDMESLVRNVCRNLVRTRWGREAAEVTHAR